MTIQTLLQNTIHLHADAPAIYSEGRVVSYADYGKALADCAVDTHRYTLVDARPETDVIVCLMAVMAAGGVAVPFNSRHPLPHLRRVLSPVLEPGETLQSRAVHLPPALRPALAVMTSGSGGTPKLALLSAENLCANARMANENIPLAPGDGWLLSLPLYHVSGMAVLVRCALAGAAVVLPGGGELLSALQQPQATHCSLVPTQLLRLMESAEGREALGRMRAILLGGAPVSDTLLNRALGTGLNVCPSYGLTETASQITACAPAAPAAERHSAGRGLGDGVLRIDAQGQILVGGPSRFLGYLTDAGVETPFDTAGFFGTGDAGHWDERGNLRVTGRMDNRFSVGGEKIQPEWLENVLAELPGVLRAVVAPLPDAVYGATPAAFLQCAPDSPWDPAAWREMLAKRLPRHALPRRFFPWPPETPEGGVKIDRAWFAEEARKCDGACDTMV